MKSDPFPRDEHKTWAAEVMDHAHPLASIRHSILVHSVNAETCRTITTEYLTGPTSCCLVECTVFALWQGVLQTTQEY